MGGLGIHKSFERNRAFLAKLYWRTIFDESACWNEICKYRLSLSSCGTSHIGKCLLLGKSIANKGYMKIISSGVNSSFWFDPWLSLGTIRSLIAGPLNRDEDVFSVADVSLAPEVWDWNACSFVFPQSLINHINSIRCNPLSSSHDTWAWKFNLDGKFDLKSAYHFAVDNLNTLPQQISCVSFKWVWRIPTHFRKRLFIWKVLKKANPSRDVLISKQMIVVVDCPFCGQAPESIQHILKDRPVTSWVWSKISNVLKIIDNNDFFLWVECNA